MSFFSKNDQFFNEHDFGDLPLGFIQRLGVFDKCKLIKSVTNVFDQWTDIYKNAKEHVFTILQEMPSSYLEAACKRMNNGIKFCHILSETANIEGYRKEVLKKLGFEEFVKNKSIERRMKEKVQVSMVLNKNESMIVFPSMEGGPDLRYAFYGNSEDFWNWCIDYWRYCWANSKRFDESKLF